MWHQAKEAQPVFTDVFEVVNRFGRNVDNVAFAHGFFLSVAEDIALSIENKDFVFPVVRMVWRLGFWLEFEVAHSKIGRAVLSLNEPSYLDARFARVFVSNFTKVYSFKAQ
jgi:hypothetical protein